MTDSAARKAYFKEGERITREYYLADPSNPYRQSGKTDGAQHWEITRRCIAEAVNTDGDYLDLGCANGLCCWNLWWDGARNAATGSRRTGWISFRNWWS